MITGDQKGYLSRWTICDNNEQNEDRVVTVKEVSACWGFIAMLLPRSSPAKTAIFFILEVDSTKVVSTSAKQGRINYFFIAV
jgi:hypothetical protein